MLLSAQHTLTMASSNTILLLLKIIFQQDSSCTQYCETLSKLPYDLFNMYPYICNVSRLLYLAYRQLIFTLYTFIWYLLLSSLLLSYILASNK